MADKNSFDWARFPAQHEIEESESEADVSRIFYECAKNPGHVNFVPIKDFNLNHLPEDCRDEELEHMVKCLAAQTVKLQIGWVSLERPMCDPITESTYPFYDKRGSRSIRLGTGRIRRVAKFVKGKDKYGMSHYLQLHYCPCEKCVSSGERRDVWWEIQILTARHVVYDNSEAECTSCVLFYDEDGDSNGSVVLKGIYAVYSDSLRDSCEMTCITCDQALAERLESLLGEYDRLKESVHAKYKHHDGKLTIIISHPHGMSKRVTLGSWQERSSWASDKNVSQFTYSNSTCPGSSGALVYIPGLVYSRLYYHHVHSGCDDNGISRSGIGEEEFSY
ncbi:hypothetical protein Bpfe_020581 [Biomphalaria pfeifferi]|uniref:Uncharacterized protein n=1 Tax=Biomphalaria pfeifferi TaxID=112525 RepID=A0AAD8F3J3_BIOPF|nr:hypothetical protein Bpfe_020581 [Biomphalaria pfeifferi]